MPKKRPSNPPQPKFDIVSANLENLRSALLTVLDETGQEKLPDQPRWSVIWQHLDSLPTSEPFEGNCSVPLARACKAGLIGVLVGIVITYASVEQQDTVSPSVVHSVSLSGNLIEPLQEAHIAIITRG